MEDKKYLFDMSQKRENGKDVFAYYYIDNDNLKSLSKKLNRLVKNKFQDDYEPINIMFDKYIEDEFIEKVPLRIETWDDSYYTHIELIFDRTNFEFNYKECLKLIRVLRKCQAKDDCDEYFIYHNIHV